MAIKLFGQIVIKLFGQTVIKLFGQIVIKLFGHNYLINRSGRYFFFWPKGYHENTPNTLGVPRTEKVGEPLL